MFAGAQVISLEDVLLIFEKNLNGLLWRLCCSV